MPSEDLGPLPAGRHGYSREQVAHHQRERLIAGLANFESKEQCFLAAFEVVVDHLRELIAEAAAPQPDWPHRAIAATRATLAFLAAEPDLARLCLVESRGAGPAVIARFAEAVGELAPALHQGRAERPEGERLPASTEDSTVGSLVSLAHRKVAAGEAKQLEDLLPDCTELVLLPYLGPSEAARLASVSSQS
jgi:AcrR family transcriptional regulator